MALTLHHTVRRVIIGHEAKVRTVWFQKQAPGTTTQSWPGYTDQTCVGGDSTGAHPATAWSNVSPTTITRRPAFINAMLFALAACASERPCQAGGPQHSVHHTWHGSYLDDTHIVRNGHLEDPTGHPCDVSSSNATVALGQQFEQRTRGPERSGTGSKDPNSGLATSSGGYKLNRCCTAGAARERSREGHACGAGHPPGRAARAASCGRVAASPTAVDVAVVVQAELLTQWLPGQHCAVHAAAASAVAPAPTPPQAPRQCTHPRTQAHAATDSVPALRDRRHWALLRRYRRHPASAPPVCHPSSGG